MIQGLAETQGQLLFRALTADVHEEDPWFFIEEVVMQSSNLETVVLQGRDDWVHFLLQERQVTHDHSVLAHILEGDPTPETQGGGHRFAIDADVQIVPGKTNHPGTLLHLPPDSQNLIHLREIARGPARLHRSRTHQDNAEKYHPQLAHSSHQSNPPDP